MINGIPRFESGDVVRPTRDRAARLFTDKLPRRRWWHWLLGIPAPTFTVVSNRFQTPRCGIGGTYTTVKDNLGAHYELPQCFLERR